MGWGEWMATPATLEAQASLAIQRRQLQKLSHAQLEATADQLLVAFHDRDRLLRNAMKRLAELEIRQALMDHGAAARQLQSEQNWLHRFTAAFARQWQRRHRLPEATL